ncbi:MAG: PAS domain S-box protein [Desulfarculaceae bacterium]|nr:PAS domain S-box protein [Desulfarculaceae bacterium]
MYSRFKISSRLRWGFVVLLTLLFIVGLLGLYAVNRVSRINRSMYKHPFTVSNATQRLETNSVRMQVFLDQMMAVENPVSQRNVVNRLNAVHRKVEQDLALIAERYLGPRKDVAQARELYARWMGLHDRVSRLVLDGESSQALELLRLKNRPMSKACQAATQVIRQFAFQKADFYIDKSQESLRQAKWMLAAAVVVAVLMAGLLAFWLGRSITRPLSQVAALSEAMASGRPAEPVSYQADDDLGRLAANLRAMLSGLVGEATSLKDHIPAVLWMADLNLMLTFVNPAAAPLAEALAGRPLDQILLQLTVEQVFADQEGLTPLLAADVLAREVERAAEVDFTHNGKSLHLQQVIAPMHDLDGRLTGVMGVGLDISDRRRMERALAESESQFRRAIMSAPLPIMLHAEGGEVVQVNQAWTRLTGYSAEQLDTLEHWLRLAYGEDWAKVDQVVSDLHHNLTGPQRQGEFTIRTADGQQVVWDFSSAPLGNLPDGRRLVLSMATDVTRRKRDEAAIREAEERFRTLVQNVPGAVYRCFHDADWTMIYVSESIEEVTGYPAEDFIGNRVRSYESLIVPEDQARVRAEVEAALEAGRPFTLEYRVNHAGGGQRWIFEKGSEVRGEQGAFFCLDGVLIDITEQKRAEQARLRSEALYAAMFDRAGDAILLMAADGEEAGTILAANQAAAVLHGYEVSELIGMKVSDLVVEHKPGRMERILSGEWVLDEVEHRRKDGSTFPLEISAGIVALEGERFILAMDRDISGRKQAEKERREREVRFRELFNNMSSGVAIYRVSPDGREFFFQDINPAGLRMAGHALEQVIGAEVREVFPRINDLGLLQVFQRVWASGRPEHHPATLYEDENLSLWVENYVCKLPSGEVVAIYDDLTQIRKEEQERARLEGQLLQSQKLEALGTLAGGIAHDFNNILAAIMGYTELARSEVSPRSRALPDLDQVLAASERARVLVRQILSFARRSQEPRSPMGLTPVIQETFRLLRATVPATVEMVLHEPLAKEQVDADPTQMHQLIMNLCTNAAQAMEDEGGQLELSLDRVELDRESAAGYADLEAGSYLRLCVNDDGPGIPPEIKGRIFEPFFTTKEPHQGTGMGLAVVHGIVAAHGGAVTVYSELGQGTTFHVYLPVYGGVEQEKVPEALPMELGGDERILFVDDEPALADLGARVLGHIGYRVESFTSPKAAWEAFAATPEGFDLVVSDYTMPKMTGQDLAGKIANLSPGTPVIICSGFNRRIDDQWLERLGVSAVLNKPLVVRELAEAVRRALDNKPKPAE